MGGDKGKRIQVHVPYELLRESFDQILDYGINPEIYMDGEFLDFFDPDELVHIREGFEKKGLSITMHGPYMELNPGSLDESIRRNAEYKYELALKAASFLRPKTIVLHGGYHEKKFRGNVELWIEQSMKTWPRFVKEAERLGVVIAVEHIFEKDPYPLKALIEKINSPFFRACIDTGHLNVFSNGNTEEWLRELGPYLAEVHLHDNDGTHDEHLPLGDGRINFRLFFMLLKKYAQDPVYTIEPHGEQNVYRGIEAIRKFLGE